jgi:HK97 family phage prohead protease
MQHLDVKTAVAIGDTGAVSGTAWVFGQPDRVGDVIVKGAFAGAAVPLPMLFMHNQADPVGVWDALVETDAGLEVRGQLLVEDVARAREVGAFVSRGAIRGLSIGFITKASEPRRGGGRTIKALELAEISLVTVPMHPGAGLDAAKSAAAAMRTAEAINRAAAALRR